jgi:predicted dehydrogenase
VRINRVKPVARYLAAAIHNVRAAWNFKRLETRALSRPVKIAVIGSGKAASYHLDALSRIGNLEVACIVNRGRSDASHLLKRYRISTHYDSLSDALDRREFEAALVAVSIPSTAEVTYSLAKSGVRCLVEKPLALNTRESEKLCQLDSQNRHSVAYNRRFYSSVLRARELIDAFGIPYSAHIEASEDMYKILAASGEDDLTSRLITNTTHALDLFTLFLGKAVDTKAMHARRFLGNVPISFQSSSRFENGCTGTFVSHWQSPSNWLVSLYGDQYQITIDLNQNECRARVGKKLMKYGPNVEDRCLKAGVYLQDWNFFEAVARDESPPLPLCSFIEAHETLALAESIQFAFQERSINDHEKFALARSFENV